MANSDKNILITPNIGSSSDDPKIVFSGADSSTTAQDITLYTYPQSSGTLSFEGSAGQLFSITNDLTGTIFSVNDVSGIPSIEVEDDGTVKFAEYAGNVLIGTGTDDGSNKLQVNGTIHSSGTITAAAPDFAEQLEVHRSGGSFYSVIKYTNTAGELGKIGFTDGSTPIVRIGTSGTNNTIWHSGNDGSGSGLDADLLDGQQGSYYDHRRYTDADTYLGGYYVSGGSEKPNNTIFNKGKLKIAMLSGSNLGFGGSWNDVLWMSTYTGSDVKPSWAIVGDKYSDNVYVSRQNYDSSSWGTGHKLWHSGNDGSGSNLDADKLDGIQASSFLRSDANDTASQRIVFSANDTNNWDTIATSTGSLGAFEVYNNGVSNDAFMTFHVGGDFACYFGLDGGINDLAVGGWSYGAVSHRIWHAGNDGSGSGLDADLLDGQHGSYYATASDYLPLTGGTVTGNLTLSTSLNAYGDIRLDGQWPGTNDSVGLGTSVFNAGTNHIQTTAIGKGAMSATGGSGRCTAVGYNAARVTSADDNTAIGCFSMYSGTPQILNTAVGAYSLYSVNNGAQNTAVGGRAGYNVSNGSSNVFVGGFSGHNKTSGNYNTAIGQNSGYVSDLESNQTFVGGYSGYSSDGGNNVGIGYFCGYGFDGFGNIAIGSSSGSSSSTGDYNILIGYNAELASSTDSNTCRIGENSGYSGQITKFTVDGCNFTMDTTALYYGAEIRAGGDVVAYYSSDETLKENIETIPNALDKVSQIRGVSYDWKQEVLNAKGKEDDYFNRKHDVGVIAQDVEKVLPEVVAKRKDGTLAVRYEKLTALLIESVKELKDEVDALKAEIKEIKNGSN